MKFLKVVRIENSSKTMKVEIAHRCNLSLLEKKMQTCN